MSDGGWGVGVAREGGGGYEGCGEVAGLTICTAGHSSQLAFISGHIFVSTALCASAALPRLMAIVLPTAQHSRGSQSGQGAHTGGGHQWGVGCAGWCR